MPVKKDKQTLSATIAGELQRLLTQDAEIIHLLHQIIDQHLAQQGTLLSPQESRISSQSSQPTPPPTLSTQHIPTYSESLQLLCLLELEKWFRARPYLFSGFLRQPSVITPQEMQAILQRAAQEKLLSSTEITALGAASLLIKGEPDEDNEEHFLIIQLSLNAEVGDVERAFELATYLRKIGIKAAPLVVAKTFSPQALQLAKEIHVALLEDVFPFSS